MKIISIVIMFLFSCAVNSIAQENDTSSHVGGINDMRKNALYDNEIHVFNQWDMEQLDTVLLKVQFFVKYRETMDGPLQEDVEALYIGNHMSEFRENINQYVWDHAPQELKGNPLEWDEETMQKAVAYESLIRRYKPSAYTIQKNYPESGKQRCYNYLMFEFVKGNHPKVNPNIYYDEPMPQLKWDMEEGDTVICDYACQRASTIFRGRTWQVWYALELPYQDGPWKLQGLPGLIMKADDHNGDFSFEATEIVKPEREYIVNHPVYEQYSKGKPKQVKQLIELRYKNPRAFLLKMCGEGIVKAFEGKGFKINIPQTSRTPCLIEKYE